MTGGHSLIVVDLPVLRYVSAVAATGSVSAAAAALHVTQPAVSRQVRRLERELGVDLFDRRGGRLVLSPAGRALLPLVDDLLAQADRLEVAARMHASGRLETVTIAAPSTTLTDLVSPFVATLEPGDPVPSVLDDAGRDPAALLRGPADLVISSAPRATGCADVELVPLPLWAYVPAGHAWASRRRVAVADLAGADVVALGAGHPSRTVLESAVSAGGGGRPRSLLEASNGTVAQALAAAGRGVAVLSDDPRFDLRGLPLVDDRGRPVRLVLRCQWRADHPGAAVLASMASRLAAWVVAQYGTTAPDVGGPN